MAEDPFSGTGAAYLHHLLLAALTGPRVAESPAPGRLVAQILVALHRSGGDRLVGRYLAPVPGLGARFVVLAGASVNDAPTTMGPSEALLQAGQRVCDSAVEVVGETSSGVRRRVLEGSPGQPLRYLWPEPAEYEGEDDACVDALEEWAWIIDRRRAEPLTGEPIELREATPAEVAHFAPSPALAVIPSRPALPTDLIADAVRQALSDVTVEVDLTAVERLVAEALATALEHGTPLDRPTAPGDSAAGDSASPGDRAALAVGRPVMGPEMVDQVAEAIASRVLAGGDRHPVPESGLARATLAAAAEELHLQLEAVTDRIRSGTRSLQALADEMAAQERSANTHVDRVAQRFDSSVDRLERRISERLDALTKTSAGPSDEQRALTGDLAALVAALGRGGASTEHDDADHDEPMPMPMLGKGYPT